MFPHQDKNCQILLFSLPSTDVFDFMKPLMKKNPNHVVINIGTNNLSNTNLSPHYIANNISSLTISVTNHGIKCSVKALCLVIMIFGTRVLVPFIWRHQEHDCANHDQFAPKFCCDLQNHTVCHCTKFEVIWTNRNSYGPKKLEDFLLCCMRKWTGGHSFAHQHDCGNTNVWRFSILWTTETLAFIGISTWNLYIDLKLVQGVPEKVSIKNFYSDLLKRFLSIPFLGHPVQVSGQCTSFRSIYQ